MIPEGLRWLDDSEEGAAWLDALPKLVDACTRRWSLRLGIPYPGSYVSLVLPGTLPDDSEVVLKIQWPHRESEHEAAALELWGGEGAVRLLDHEPSLHAFLIERCEPGTHLSDIDADQALDVLIGLLPRLWKTGARLASSPFRALADEAAWWLGELPEQWKKAGRPFERRLLEAAIDALDSLKDSQGEQVLLHQDLHADNVLRAQREPWLAIDPKPLTGEREFSVAPIVRAYELGHGREQVLGRLDRVTEALGLDRGRARGWAIAQTLAWAINDAKVHIRHVETARWLLESR